jgi:hypothetical protein
MFKSITLIVVILATITFAKEDSNAKKKEEVGTVIGIDLGVSFSLNEKSFFKLIVFILDNIFMCWYI